mmetsp:Transcript_63955/g.120027  ORF Transcript_63955/g.120027 Transcript_63955/m.120027 type:complete len:212 (-) Transcript_63955:161-796(-)
MDEIGHSVFVFMFFIHNSTSPSCVPAAIAKHSIQSEAVELHGLVGALWKPGPELFQSAAAAVALMLLNRFSGEHAPGFVSKPRGGAPLRVLVPHVRVVRGGPLLVCISVRLVPLLVAPLHSQRLETLRVGVFGGSVVEAPGARRFRVDVARDRVEREQLQLVLGIARSHGHREPVSPASLHFGSVGNGHTEPFVAWGVRFGVGAKPVRLRI